MTLGTRYNQGIRDTVVASLNESQNMIKIEAKNQIKIKLSSPSRGRMISGSIIALPGIYNYRQVSTAQTAALSSGSSNRMDFLRGVQYFFLGVFPIFEISCYLIIFMRSSDIAFRKRNTAMIYICTAAAWFAYANLIFGLFGGIYCGIFHTFIILVQTLTVGPQLLRGITLWGMLEHNKFMLEYGETAKLRRMHLKSKLEEENNEQAIQEGESNSFTTDDEALTLKVDNEVQRRKGCAKEKARAARKKMQLLVKASKIILIGLPAILIITMLFVSNQGSMLKTDFDECFPEPGFILNIGRGFSIAFTIAAIASTVPVRHCNDGLGIRREIARNIAIIFITNVAIFATAYHKKYEIILILYIMQQMALSFSMIVMPYFLSSESPNPMLHYIKNMGKSAMPGYGRTLPNVHGGRSSLFVGINSRESIIDQKRQREMTMSLDAGLCILLSSPDGIKLFTEHCSREFR